MNWLEGAAISCFTIYTHAVHPWSIHCECAMRQNERWFFYHNHIQDMNMNMNIPTRESFAPFRRKQIILLYVKFSFYSRSKLTGSDPASEHEWPVILWGSLYVAVRLEEFQSFVKLLSGKQNQPNFSEPTQRRVTLNIFTTYSVADLGGAPPGCPNSFDFMHFLEKFGKIVCLRPPWGVGASLGKYWIRCWYY